MKDNMYLKIIKKKMVFVFTFLFILTLSFIMMVVLMNYNHKNQYIIIDVYAKQRMLTQKLTKDAYKKYELLEINKNDDQIVLLNHALVDIRNEFESTLSSLETGLLIHDHSTLRFKKSLNEMTPLIERTFNEWEQFKASIDIIIDSQDINEEFIHALDYIDSHNLLLLEYSDEITQSLIHFYNKQTNQFLIVSMISFIISFLSLVVIILQLQKYILSPLNELYKRFSDFGFLNRNHSNTLLTKKEIQPIVEDINNGFMKLNHLIDLIQKINEETSFDGTLSYIYHSFSPYIPYTHIGIALLKDNGETLQASYGISDPALIDKFIEMVGLKVRVKDTSLSHIIHEGRIRVINDLDDYNKNKQTKYNLILKNAGIKSSITMPLKINNNPVGVIFFSSIYKNIYTSAHISFLETLSSSISISFNKNIFIDELIYSTILALAKMAEARDEETGDHLDRMKKYAVKITELLKEEDHYTNSIDYEFIKNIEKFSPMHDIGKVGVRDGILLKPGKLTTEEYDEMKKHTLYGAEVLQAAEQNIAKSNKSLFRVGIEIALSHHEKWDGSGYPYHIKGEEIPISARIVAVADVLDALTSKRPYKEPFSFDDSFSIIMEGKGKHFDPIIIDTLNKHRDDFYQIYRSFNGL